MTVDLIETLKTSIYSPTRIKNKKMPFHYSTFSKNETPCVSKLLSSKKQRSMLIAMALFLFFVEGNTAQLVASLFQAWILHQFSIDLGNGGGLILDDF